MSAEVVAGPPTPARIDWAMYAGSDFTVPMLWKSGGTVVDLTAATVTIDFGAAPTGKTIPVDITTGATTADGGTVTVSNGSTGANMVVFIPAAATAGFTFGTLRYTMTVTLAGLGTLRWAEGDITLEGRA